MATTLVSTGQFTIVDNNDARTITAVLTTSSGTQQVYSKSDTAIAYLPDYVASNLTLRPKLYISGLTEAQVWANLSARQFSFTQGGDALTSSSAPGNFVNNADVLVTNPFTITGTTDGSSTLSQMVVNANLRATTGTAVIFFEAVFTDPVTQLTSPVITQITLSTVKTGTNAVYINIRGQTSVAQATGATKNNICVAADLIRSNGPDTSDLIYKWYESNASGKQICTTNNNVANYGTKNSAAGQVPLYTTETLGTGLEIAGSANNTLIISEKAVNKIGIYRVDITDTVESKTYTQYFTINDISDPYQVTILSSSGDKLQNGIGTTTLTPVVYNGAALVAPLTGWSFTWRFYDRNSKRGAFIDTTKITTSGGAPITVNTTGLNSVFTYTGAGYAFQAGDVIKAVKPTGAAYFYEVLSSTVGTPNTVTMRTPEMNNWLLIGDFPAPTAASDFVSGKLYGCVSLAGAGTRVTAATPFTIPLTGDEVDAKSTVICDATRP